MIDLSIIIVTYNPGEIFFDCLKSISSGVGTLAYEVIVIDNASQDGIVQQAVPKFPDVQFILNADNKGFAGGNNQGLKQATGQFLLLLNPDVIVHENSITTLVRYLEKNSSVGIVGPRTFDANGLASLTAQASYNAFTILWKYLGFALLFPDYFYGKYRRTVMSNNTIPFEVSWVQGSCLLFRREVYDAVGGLDEGFFLFSEEPDFCERAMRSGWKTVYIPTATVAHFESTAVSRYPERRIRAYHLSPLYYLRKRNLRGQIWILKLGFTVELLAKMGVRLLQLLRGNSTGPLVTIYLQVLREVWRY